MAPITNTNLQYIWHPCTQMKDYESFEPLSVRKAGGSYLELTNGKKVIDAISSWWCKSLGHANPRLKAALLKQLDQFEHVILANTTNEIITLLSEKLAQLMPSLNKVFYAGDGSCAVEIAMKMSLHSRLMTGEFKRTQFIALENGYHGETTGALSVSDIGVYKKPYQSMLFDVAFISSIPYVQTIHDPLWADCHLHWQRIETQLEKYANSATAIIVEPIVQGAAGMRIYSQDFLKRLRAWSQKHHVHLIADEIMTGIGRTGKMLACEHAQIEPDFLCLAKGLTSGWMPFSAVLTRHDIYDLFYDDAEKGRAFLHSHTYSGNALAASVAVEVLNIMAELSMCQRANELGESMLNAMNHLAAATGKIHNIRQIGAIVAADLICEPHQRHGFTVYKKAIELGALLRPLGNTIYWLPPLTTEKRTIDELQVITQNAILSANGMG